MSIRNKKGELLPHNFERTLLTSNSVGIVAFVEGSNFEFDQLRGGSNGIGQAGGSLSFDKGIYFTKEHLQIIVDNMKEGSRMIVAKPHSMDRDGLIKDFEEYNQLVQVEATRFCPKDTLKERNLKPYRP